MKKGGHNKLCNENRQALQTFVASKSGNYKLCSLYLTFVVYGGLYCPPVIPAGFLKIPRTQYWLMY
jgi:hypothetical protein